MYHIVQYKKGYVIFITNVLSYLFTTVVFRLIMPAMETMMLSVRSTWAIGIVVFKILNFFRRPITRSILILTCAICLDISISLAIIFFHLVNAGMRSTAPLEPVPPQARNLDQLIHNLHELGCLENLILG